MVLLEEVTIVFQKVFQNQNLKLMLNTTNKDIEAWDSLHHMDLINELEHHFKINITLKEAMQMNSVSEILELLKTKKES